MTPAVPLRGPRVEHPPATRAGGWRNLPSLTQSQRIQYETILNLILASRLPDLTNGALFFQNARIVAERGQALLSDLGSTNGTQVDGVAIGKAVTPLSETGQEISFGAAKLRLSRLIS